MVVLEPTCFILFGVLMVFIQFFYLDILYVVVVVVVVVLCPFVFVDLSQERIVNILCRV